MNVIKKGITSAILLFTVVLGNTTLVSCGDKVDPDALAKKVPSTVNTIVVGDKTYGGDGFTVNVYCTSGFNMTHKSFTTQGGTIIYLGGSSTTNTKTYKVVLPSSSNLNDGEATVHLMLYELNTSNITHNYTSLFADSGTITVTTEGGKRVAKYSGVTAKVYNGIANTLPQSKEDKNTVLAGYIACP
jgi:hypothetical protein